MKINPAGLKALSDGDMENFIVAATTGGIEAQEAKGQQSFVNSGTLPKDCPVQDLKNIGFKFGEDADDLFVNVDMPKGWKIEPTDHSMWSELIDKEGRKRGSIFYKAAFYDRSAHMSLNQRFSIETNYDLVTEHQFFVTDCSKRIWATDKIKFKEKYKGDYSVLEEKCRTQALNWLKANYPEWEEKSAYWDSH